MVTDFFTPQKKTTVDAKHEMVVESPVETNQVEESAPVEKPKPKQKSQTNIDME